MRSSWEQAAHAPSLTAALSPIANYFYHTKRPHPAPSPLSCTPLIPTLNSNTNHPSLASQQLDGPCPTTKNWPLALALWGWPFRYYGPTAMTMLASLTVNSPIETCTNFLPPIARLQGVIGSPPSLGVTSLLSREHARRTLLPSSPGP